MLPYPFYRTTIESDDQSAEDDEMVYVHVVRSSHEDGSDEGEDVIEQKGALRGRDNRYTGYGNQEPNYGRPLKI